MLMQDFFTPVTCFFFFRNCVRNLKQDGKWFFESIEDVKCDKMSYNEIKSLVKVK